MAVFPLILQGSKVLTEGVPFCFAREFPVLLPRVPRIFIMVFRGQLKVSFLSGHVKKYARVLR